MKKITFEIRDCDYEYLSSKYNGIHQNIVEEIFRLGVRDLVVDCHSSNSPDPTPRNIEDAPSRLHWYVNAMLNDSNFIMASNEAESEEEYKEWNAEEFDDSYYALADV